MSSSQRVETSVRHAPDSAAIAPACPLCGLAMAVRPLRHGDDVDGLLWRCRRELICSGTRRIRDPLVIQPAADSSTHAIFEWERSRDRRGWSAPSTPPTVAKGGRGLLGRMNRAMARPVETQSIATTIPLGARSASDDPLAGLVEYGFVVLDDRRVPSARAVVDNVVIGPTGIFVIDRNAWPGQISASADQIYVDGRQRTGATDEVVRAAAAVEAALAHELKPIGAHVQSVISFDAASNRLFEAKLGKIMLSGKRSLVKVIRAGEESLGPETVVRLALAADRLLD